MEVKIEDTAANTRRRCVACDESFKPWNITARLYAADGDAVGDVCQRCLEAGPGGIKVRLQNLADRFQGWTDSIRSLLTEAIEAPSIEEFRKAVADDEAAFLAFLPESERQKLERAHEV